MNRVPGGYSIWSRIGNGWTGINGGGFRITIGPDKFLRVVSSTDQIYAG
jgi:hypothetical protein